MKQIRRYDNIAESYAGMEHLPSVLLTPFPVATSPSCRIPYQHDVSFLHPSIVPQSSSAMM
jgi:hypothetical protein